jgi:hypothetical protein
MRHSWIIWLIRVRLNTGLGDEREFRAKAQTVFGETPCERGTTKARLLRVLAVGRDSPRNNQMFTANSLLNGTDRNPAPDATDKFREIVEAYAVCPTWQAPSA